MPTTVFGYTEQSAVQHKKLFKGVSLCVHGQIPRRNLGKTLGDMVEKEPQLEHVALRLGIDR